MKISEYFNHRAQGYAAAISTLGSSRALDAYPFRILVSSLGLDGGSAIDMFCGTGFLTWCVDDLFDQVYGVDASSEMIGHVRRNRRDVFLISDEQQAPHLPRKLLGRIESNKSNVILSLAGLHHWFDSNEPASQGTNSIQVRTVESWVNAVGNNGTVVIADVTDRSIEVALEVPPVDRRGKRVGKCELLVDLQDNCPGARDLIGRVLVTRNIRDYHEALGDCAGLCMRSNPAEWFEEIVAKRSELGHTHRFIKPVPFIEDLQKKGISGKYVEMPTPWFFPNKGIARSFLSKLFGVNTADAEWGINNHLVTKDEGNYFVVGWRLGFYVFGHSADS